MSFWKSRAIVRVGKWYVMALNSKMHWRFFGCDIDPFSVIEEELILSMEEQTCYIFQRQDIDRFISMDEISYGSYTIYPYDLTIDETFLDVCDIDFEDKNNFIYVKNNYFHTVREKIENISFLTLQEMKLLAEGEKVRGFFAKPLDLKVIASSF